LGVASVCKLFLVPYSHEKGECESKLGHIAEVTIIGNVFSDMPDVYIQTCAVRCSKRYGTCAADIQMSSMCRWGIAIQEIGAPCHDASEGGAVEIRII
jgi:hypothetical protein